MIINLLNFNLKDFFNFYNCKFFLKTVLLLMNQLISCIEYIHTKSFIHKDIKPNNFLMSLEKHKNQINIIDFEFFKRYYDLKTHFHISYHKNKNLISTVCYFSINTHLEV